MKSTKAYVIGALTITVSLIIIGLSMSYAWFTSSVVEENSGYQGVTVQSGTLTMNFASSNYISNTAATLVNDSEITGSSCTTSNCTAFSINFPNSSTISTAKINLFLTNISMTSNFKSSYVKYKLYSSTSQNGTYTAVSGASGSFSGITLTGATTTVAGTGTDISLISSQSMNKNTTVYYRLYVWLSNDPNTQQNSLLNGTLSMKVGFRAVTG